MASAAIHYAAQLGAAALRRRAQARAVEVARAIFAIDGHDRMSLRELAAALNARGIPTPRGRGWHPETVARVSERAAA